MSADTTAAGAAAAVADAEIRNLAKSILVAPGHLSVVV